MKMIQRGLAFMAIILLAGVFTILPVSAAEVLIEAEAFEDYGGWVLDSQFIDQMGSPYLLAHGLGKYENALRRNDSR